jgi:hypothetical protein
MQLCVNERAFEGSCKTKDEAITTLLGLIDNINQTDRIRGGGPIRRTEDLKERMVQSDLSIFDFFLNLQKSTSPRDKDLAKRMLLILVKGPYISDFSAIDRLSSDDGRCLLKSSLHYAFDRYESCALVSPENSNFSSESITLTSYNDSCDISNFPNIRSINKSTWIYEKSPKHDLPKDIIVDGNVWSAMPLSDAEAQLVLSNSIMTVNKRCTYSCYQGTWYQFYNHQSNLFHGFPIKDNGNNSDLNRVKKYIGKEEVQKLGQQILKC